MNNYINSLIAYSGNKYKILELILPLFPQNIYGFMDMFCGSCSVSLNINADKIYANDINHYLIDLYKYLQAKPVQDIIDSIYEIIDDFNLDGYNRDGFLSLRKEYNDTHYPLYLYLLTVYGYKDQIRFNNKGEFNNSFREGRMFSEKRLNKLIDFMNVIKRKDITFSSKSFNNINIPSDVDFVYIDPPYLVTNAAYNDESRCFGGWNETKEYNLLKYIDKNIDRKGIKFALSNVLEHNGVENELLSEWSEKYNVHYLDINTRNQSEQRYMRKEVLITNY